MTGVWICADALFRFVWYTFSHLYSHYCNVYLMLPTLAYCTEGVHFISAFTLGSEL